jgi:hypothetical protein
MDTLYFLVGLIGVLFLLAIVFGIILGIYKTIKQRTGKVDDLVGEPFKVPEFEVVIEYSDANGKKTERVVTVRTIYKEKRTVTRIEGYCHKRHEQRTFIVSRIVSMQVNGASVIPRDYLQSVLEKGG